MTVILLEKYRSFFKENHDTVKILKFPWWGEESLRLLIEKLNHPCKFPYQFILLDINFNPITVSLPMQFALNLNAILEYHSKIFKYPSSKKTCETLSLAGV
jgi:hypothetical protein